MLQVGSALPVEIDHIVKHNGEPFPESLLYIAQPNCSRYEGSVEPSILMGVITIPMLHRIRLEVGNNEFSFSQILAVFDK